MNTDKTRKLGIESSRLACHDKADRILFRAEAIGGYSSFLFFLRFFPTMMITARTMPADSMTA